MSLFKKIFHYTVQFLIGILLALVLFLSFDLGYIVFENSLPVSTIFTSQVSVPDFVSGTDTLVVYNRTIYQTFTGNFSVELKNTNNLTECYGFGENILYEKNEQIDPKKFTLSYYIAAPESCIMNLDPGQYYLITNYTIRLDNFPPKQLTTHSNIFNVLAKGSTPSYLKNDQTVGSVPESNSENG